MNLRCWFGRHSFQVVPGKNDDDTARVICSRCLTEGPPQRCPWCDEAMTMIPSIDYESHRPCFVNQMLFG